MLRPWFLGLLLTVSCVSQGVGTSERPLRGGHATNDPAVGALVRIDVDHVPACTGVRLTSRVVLTSRHCVSLTTAQIQCTEPAVLANFPSEALAVAEPNGDSASTTGVARVHYVDGARCEGEPFEAACSLCGQDLALLELQAPFEGPTLVVASNAPDAADTFAVFGIACPGAPDALMTRCDQLDVQTVDPASVEAVLGREVVVRVGVCEGDSGGPLLQGGELVGILSRGDEGCSRGAYTRLDVHRTWLETVLRDVAARTGDPVPSWVRPAEPFSDASVDGDASAREAAVDVATSDVVLEADAVLADSAQAWVSDGLDVSTLAKDAPDSGPGADGAMDGQEPLLRGDVASEGGDAGRAAVGDAPEGSVGGGCSLPGTRRGTGGLAAVVVLALVRTRRRSQARRS